jgi:hypothetical protein
MRRAASWSAPGASRQASQARAGSHTPYAVRERDHRLLHEGLAGLRAWFTQPGASDAASLRAHIEAVRTQLRAQFAFEELIGHMHYLHAVRPSVAPAIERLRREHGIFLATLDWVAAQLRTGRPGPDVSATVLSLLERFVDHELDDRQLVRAALLRPDLPLPRS